jgi:hypothetical protein
MNPNFGSRKTGSHLSRSEGARVVGPGAKNPLRPKQKPKQIVPPAGRSCTNDIPVFNRSFESRKLIGIIINKAQGALSAHSRSLKACVHLCIVEVVREELTWL